MPIKSFAVPVCYGDWAERELNRFVQSHRVLAIDRHWVDQGRNSFWAVWVEYVETSAGMAGNGSPPSERKKIDYKERLSSEDFATYLRLRDLRKAIAAEDGVALYAVFTNEQLAQIVERQACSKADLQQIDGLGDARLEKYGPRVLEFLNTLRNDQDEAGGKPLGSDR